MASEEGNPQIYHEKQRRQYCLLHSLNNLFQQRDAFTRRGLNAIADKLVVENDSNSQGQTCKLFSLFCFKPHHSVFTGNYDVNVLIAAMEEKGKNVVWHDRRNRASTIDLDAPEDILMGIVINVEVSMKQFGRVRSGRHWVTLKKINGVWYNLDSELDDPETFPDVNHVRGFLDSNIDNGAEVLLVMNQNQNQPQQS